MARVLEDDAKHLLSAYGLTTPVGERATTPKEAGRAAARYGRGSVVKALVPIGRRGKAGMVRRCTDARAVESAAEALLGSTHEAYQVCAVLVEEAIDIVEEYYLSVEIDPGRLEYALLLSRHGGVDVEENADAAVRIGNHPSATIARDAVRRGWRDAGVSSQLEPLVETTCAVMEVFRQLDATLLEINPLAIDAAGRVVAVGVMLAVDDMALRRHPEVAAVALEGSERAWRPETELETRVSSFNADHSQRGSARYLELVGGDIGFLCGGGGASLLLFDALVAAGGAPANYSEFGGNPTEQRVYDLTRVVLDKPGVRGLFIAHNITNNTQVDVVARGVVRALADAGKEQTFPVVAREVGVNDDEGRCVFEAAGVEYLGIDYTLNQAAQRMVERMDTARIT
jgi:succinyl-CoA synthetase beta subunit